MNLDQTNRYILFNPTEADFLKCTDYNYNDCVERFVALSLYKALQDLNYPLEADIHQTLGFNPHYDFKIKEKTFELKCSLKTELVVEIGRGKSKGASPQADPLLDNPLLYPDLQRSSLTVSKADYYIWLSPGFSNTFRGKEVFNPLTGKRGRNLFKIRIFPTTWIFEDIRRNRDAILREWSARVDKKTLTNEQLRDTTTSFYKLRHFPRTSLGPSCWSVVFHPTDYPYFKSNDGWVGYVGTKEVAQGKYLADLTDFAWESERLKRVLPLSLFKE